MDTLYELTQQMVTLMGYMLDEECDPEMIEATMEGLEMEIELKADSYAKVIANLEVEMAKQKAVADQIKLEAEKHTKAAKAIETNIKRMKENLMATMNATGKTKFKTELFSFGIKKNPPKMIIDNTDAIPVEYMELKFTPMNDKIKDDLKKGIAVEGAHLEQGETLTIK